MCIEFDYSRDNFLMLFMWSLSFMYIMQSVNAEKARSFVRFLKPAAM